MEVADGMSDYGGGMALVVTNRRDERKFVKIPKYSAESTYETSGISNADIIDGGTRDIVQFTLFHRTDGGNRIALRVSFHAPFYCPPDEGRLLLERTRQRMH